MTNRAQSYRKFMGYTQIQMAKLLNISVQAYRNKEKGKTPFKDIEKVKIKKEVQKNGFEDITIDEIFFGNKVAKSFQENNEEVK
ncbi:helix-turn-helix transcriptional regulator [Staphylococcus caeli]|uniref:Ps3 protein 14 family transcriptional regulator n=1 Tax=Staphylococcus caeli TaxID=2201815 RepID=A0A1D4PNJ1_9STAP|nr:hypothetical protein [Staphylococcus caeli]SCT24551.1 Ps3 protein 14 family transcriptional regulator [Staphylococcus caeli]SCT31410.1 Ps3 protein 14 family transcriptional regulator [Staphylococcus caeli]